MKKLKVLLILFFIGLIGFFSYKHLKRIFEFLKLVKTLPEYLRDIIGVKPKIDFSLNYPLQMSLKIGLAKSIKERETNLHEVIESYINDFYPDLTGIKLDIKIYEIPDENEEEKESKSEK